MPVSAAAAGGAVDTWDGTADINWYNGTATEYTITTAEQLAGLAELVSGATTFAGVTITLANDLDLYCEDTTPSADGDPLTFRPIGDHSKDGTFEGTFDGAGHSIDNLYQNGWDLGYDWDHYGSYGLFGNVNNATIKNLTISGAESYIERGDVGGITGSATGNCTFENITISDSVFATCNNGCGGIIAWSGAGSYTFKNINIESSVILAGLWGSFDTSIGGIVGQGEPGATYNFKNVDIACRLDAYNDCTASWDYYNYRMCGMIIGRLEETTTIDGVNYPDTSKYTITCDDVNVIYGDWHNYHYCEPTPSDMNGGRGMRVEPGYSYGGLPADYDHSQCVDNHMYLIPFDQIFGGKQLAVKGLRAYEGVTVHYHYDKDKEDWKFDETGHWYACNVEGCDEKILFKEHTAGEWIVEEEATASKNGVRYKECTKCGYKEVESIPKLLSGFGAFRQDVYRIFSQMFEIDVDVTFVGEDGITVDSTKGGTVTSKTGSSTVLYDRSITFSITPEEGYRIADVLYNGESVGAVTEFTAKRVKADGILEVIFEKIPEEPAETAEETEVA